MFKIVDHVLRVSDRVVGDRLSRLVMARVTSESRTAVRVGPRAALNLSPWGVRATLGRCVSGGEERQPKGGGGEEGLGKRIIRLRAVAIVPGLVLVLHVSC